MANIYIPDIIDYKPFYIQIESIAFDSTQWGLIAKTNPFPALPAPKDPYKNEWLDENGDDEYIKEMYYESLELKVDFFIKTTGDNSTAVLRNMLDSFFRAINGKELKIYDAYTQLGWKNVRYAGFSEINYKTGHDWTRAIFSVTFKINDPITRMKLDGNKIVEA